MPSRGEALRRIPARPDRVAGVVLVAQDGPPPLPA
jgi:hypothetical protein